MPLKHSTFRWFRTFACTTVLVGQQTMTFIVTGRFHHLNYSMQRTKIADSLLLGTPSGVRDFETASAQFNFLWSI